MEKILAVLAAQHAELEGLLTTLDDDGWALSSACPGWSIADVVLHLAQTDEMAIASVTGGFGDAVSAWAAEMPEGGNVDDGAGAMVERERGASAATVYERWRSGAAKLRAALGECGPSDRVPWVVGLMSARTLATTRVAECWIHTGDVADGLGIERGPAPDRLYEIARLAWRTVPYAFARAGRELSGPVGFELRGPDGERWTFAPDEPPKTTIHGDALELCQVAGQRRDAASTGLTGEGPDAEGVLKLVRTFA